MCQIYSKLTIKTTAKPGASIDNFGHILLFIIIVIEFNQINVGWAWEFIVSDNKFLFSNLEKFIILWAGEVCWATYFHSFSPNIRLWNFHDSSSKR